MIRKEVLTVDTRTKSSDFQRVIENVETLPLDDQMLLIEIIRQRLIQRRRVEGRLAGVWACTILRQSG